ncbi:RHS repeat-associated core domain-containing protein [Tenacibaculum maritimum]|uniref:RHS repeat-associated core domain-containing protein n=1 Tax=Tenacibaculum maritimum TaxID=107401 RepID=UPI003876EAA6
MPFRYQGQYEDVETGLYYNRFRYYSSDTGTYISQDPIGLLGNNPNFYAYVKDSNSWVDPFGLMAWGPLNWKGMGHHLLPRQVASSLKIPELATKDAFAWYPNKPADFPDIHIEMHRSLKENGIPWHGSKYTGDLNDFMSKAKEAYKNYDTKGVLKFRGKKGKIIMRNVTPLEALESMDKMIKNNNIPCK